MKQKQVEKIIKDRIDIEGMAKDFMTAGFVVPAKKKVSIAIGTDLMALKFSSDRMEKLSDGWIRDRFLSALHGKNFDWAPENLEQHIQWDLAQVHAAQFGRQPSVFELESLKDRTKRNPCIIDSAKILNLKTDDWYWTNEEVAGNPGSAWCVSFGIGSVNWSYKGYQGYVRPVRLSQYLGFLAI